MGRISRSYLSVGLALLILSACAPAYHTSDIARVFVTDDLCNHTCELLRATIASNGDIEYGYGRNPARSHIAPALAQSLLAQTPIAGLQGRGIDTSDQSRVIVVMKDGRSIGASFPPGWSFDDATLGKIQTWAGNAVRLARRATLGDRDEAVFASLKSGKGFEGVTLQMLGCFGSCPAYTAHFSSDGHATYSSLARRTRRAFHAVGTVDPQAIRFALLEAGANSLEPSYPLNSVDSLGAVVTIDVNGKHYRSDGRDEMSWGTTFRATVARLDQFVLDAHWSPALPARKRL